MYTKYLIRHPPWHSGHSKNTRKNNSEPIKNKLELLSDRNARELIATHVPSTHAHRDARVYCLQATAIHGMSTPPPPIRLPPS